MNFIELTNAYIGKEENMPIYINVDKIESFGPVNYDEIDKIAYVKAKSYVCVTSNDNIEYKVKETPEEILKKIDNIRQKTIYSLATNMAKEFQRYGVVK